MAILIGVDEAGYGPNYGPLVVAATAWRVEGNAECGMRNAEGRSRSSDSSRAKRAVASSPTAAAKATAASRCPDLYKLLKRAVVRTPGKNSKRLAIADSKALYTAGLGVRQLERGVLAALMTCLERRGSELPANSAACVERVADLIAAMGADPDGRRSELACHAHDELAVPIEASRDELASLAELLHRTCQESGVCLAAIRARLVYPSEFNALTEQFGSKGAALSHITLGLVRSTIDSLRLILNRDEGESVDEIFVFLDKHGGRDRYAALLQHHFPDSWITPVVEGRRESRYSWTHGEAPVEAVFRVGCEEHLPTALASMTAKYHRELAMKAFNAWWAQHLPEVRPTCGYPTDARRFRQEIAVKQRELAIADDVIWRMR